MDYKVLKDWKTRSGYRAVVIKIKMEHLCGYVGISKKHPCYKKGYGVHIPKLRKVFNKVKDMSTGKRGIIPLFCFDGKKISMDIVFDVHGSVTYSRGDKEYPIKSNLWWIGFDTAHSGDTIKKQNLRYCVVECENLAKQLRSV